MSLLKHDPFEDTTPAVTVHRLVQSAARARSEANGSAQDAAARLIARLLAAYPRDAYRNASSWPLCAKLTPHLLARLTPDNASVADLFDRVGAYFNGRAAYSQAAPLLRDALAVRERVLSLEHPETAGSLNNLALLLKDEGDLVGARPFLSVRWPYTRRPLVSSILTQRLASTILQTCSGQGDLAGARTHYERALAISEKVRGPEHRETATILNNLALGLHDQGDLAAARTLWERALAIYAKASARSIPRQRRASTISPSCCMNRATLLVRNRFSSARWR